MNKYKKARLLAELTQEEARIILGVSRQTIRNWEDPAYPYKPSRNDIIEIYKGWRKR